MQVIPHITNEIKEMIRATSETGNYDVVLIELGGTVSKVPIAVVQNCCLVSLSTIVSGSTKLNT